MSKIQILISRSYPQGAIEIYTTQFGRVAYYFWHKNDALKQYRKAFNIKRNTYTIIDLTK